MEGILGWFEPSKDINYAVICAAHLGFSLICLGLFVAQQMYPGSVDG